MAAILFYGTPALLGVIAGIFLTWQISLVLAFVVLAIGIWSLWISRDWEIGSMIGIFGIVAAIVFVLSIGVSSLIAYGIFGGLDFSWMLR